MCFLNNLSDNNNYYTYQNAIENISFVKSQLKATYCLTFDPDRILEQWLSRPWKRVQKQEKTAPIGNFIPAGRGSGRYDPFNKNFYLVWIF